MKIIKRTVYGCEFCSKITLYKGVMSLHERMCKFNPKNRHKCFEYCKFLERGNAEVYDLAGEIVGSGGYSFYCRKNKKELYSYKLERYKCNEHRKFGKERMPLKCGDYEIENGHEDYVPSKIKK